MSGVVVGTGVVQVVEELSWDAGYSKDALNRVLFKWFSEDLVEVSRVERGTGSVDVYLDSRVLSVSELRTFWLDFQKELFDSFGGSGDVVTYELVDSSVNSVKG